QSRSTKQSRGVAIYRHRNGKPCAQMALRRAGLETYDIGTVITGGSYPAIGSPCIASPIAASLGIEAPSFDLNSACSTFFTQLKALSMWQKELIPDFVLIVQPENLTRMVDYRDRNTAVLMGDCSTAAVVSLRVPGPVAADRIAYHTSPDGWQKVVAYSG